MCDGEMGLARFSRPCFPSPSPLCRTCQLSAVPLPRGPYDLPVGLVVTEDGDIIL